MENHDNLELAKFLASLPDRDPLADINNMRRTLERALGCARNGDVVLTEAEIRHWIAGIDEFLHNALLSRVINPDCFPETLLGRFP